MPNNLKPKISICVPTFNRAELLRKTLVSISKQTINPFEVLIVDNCSEDNTEEVSRGFGNFRFIRNKENLGMIGNWNRCVELATGDFLTILHSDDLISPLWYEEWQKLISLNNDNSIGAYFSAVFTIDLKENTKIVYRVFPQEKLLRPPDTFKQLWTRNLCALPASGALIYHKSIFDNLGGFDKTYSTEADIAFALKIINRFNIFYTPKLLFAYRIHPFQSFDMDDQIKDDTKKLIILSRHLDIFKEFYNLELSEKSKKPIFYKRLCFMYVSIAIFYFLIFKYNNAKKYYKLTKVVFPDIFNNISDYFLLISIILHYIQNIVIGRLMAFFIRNNVKKWAN